MKNANQELLVHPFMARKVANHVSTLMMDGRRFAQVYPGVFTHPGGDKQAIVVLGAAPISEPAVRTLRKCRHLEQFIVLQNPQGNPTFIGPRSYYSDENWADEVVDSLAMTRDVNCVMSIFEVMIASDPLSLANLASSSHMIAAHLPFELDPVNNNPFLIDLEREMDRLVEEESA